MFRSFVRYLNPGSIAFALYVIAIAVETILKVT